MVTWVEVGLDRGVTVTHHVKVITRSNLLMGENSLFLLQFCSLEMSSIMVENPNHAINRTQHRGRTKHPKSLGYE